MPTFEFDPGTAKMVLLFGGAGVVAIVGLWRTMAQARRYERERAEREPTQGERAERDRAELAGVAAADDRVASDR